MKSIVRPSYSKANHFMRIIALGRLIYGLILVGVGLAVLKLLGKNLTAEILRLIDRWHIDSHLYYVDWLLKQVSTVSHGFLFLFMVGNFLYSALAFTETAGLLSGKRWAYWLVIVDTASFIPIESYQIGKEFNSINAALLIYYLATVVYLFFQLKKLPG